MLIGLYSPAPQSGKSTVAQYLVARYAAARIPFAAPLKGMAASLVGTLPFKDRDLYEGDKSQVVYQDKTLRHLLQTLGTEWGRKCMGENFWCDMWKNIVLDELAAGQGVVADDVRFPNEFEAVKKLGGEMWRIVRPGHGEHGITHASERGLEGFEFDRVIYNNADLPYLYQQVEQALWG